MPAIAALLGQQDGKHMVATITVYFHPARSKGSMVEAIGCAAIAFLYAVFICFSSMGVSIVFGKTLHLLVLGHTIILVVFCGGGLGFVGWTKQRLSHPLVNISCSLTSLAIITVVTKEGAVQAAEFSDEKIIQVMKMIAMGVVATTAVSLLISPISAQKGFDNDLIQVTDSFGELLSMITRGFLTGSEEELKQERFVAASAKYKKTLNSLSKTLKESKYEHYIKGTEVEYGLDVKLVHCIQRLAQNLGGLRSAATTQFLLLTQCGVSIPPTPSTSHSSNPGSGVSPFLSPSEGAFSSMGNQTMLPAIDETMENKSSDETIQDHAFQDKIGVAPTLTLPSDIFSAFIKQLGPSMVMICPIVQD